MAQEQERCHGCGTADGLAYCMVCWHAVHLVKKDENAPALAAAEHLYCFDCLLKHMAEHEPHLTKLEIICCGGNFYRVRIGDLWADGLCFDEAMGVAAKFLVGGIRGLQPYMLTTEGHRAHWQHHVDVCKRNGVTLPHEPR